MKKVSKKHIVLTSPKKEKLASTDDTLLFMNDKSSQLNFILYLAMLLFVLPLITGILLIWFGMK